MGCQFCDFKDKQVIVYQDKVCFAIISKNPINKHHVMVIPRKHYQDFIDLPDNLAKHLFVVTKKLSLAVRKACKPDAIHHISDDDISRSGYNLVSHYKIHIIPRYKNDKVKIDWGDSKTVGLKARSKFAETVRNCVNR